MKETTKILILDDSKKEAQKIIDVLVNAGYTYPILHCETSEDFKSALKEFTPDVVISEHTI